MLKQRRFWIFIFLTAVFCYLIAARRDLRDFYELFQGANASFVLLSILLVLLIYFIKSAAWYFLMRPVKKNAGVHRLFSSMMIGYATEAAVGIRLRELFRAYAASQIEGVKFFSVLATVVLGRTIEGVVLALNILIVTGFFIALPRENDWSIKLAWISCAFFLALFAALYIIRKESSGANTLIKKVLQWLLESHYEAGLAYYRDFLKGLSAIGKSKTIIVVFVLFVLSRGVAACFYWSLGQSLGADLSATASGFLTGIDSMKPLIPPQLKAQAMQFHNLMAWNLNRVFHIGPAIALTFSRSIALITVLLTSSLGVLCLFLEAFRRRRARRSA